MSKLEKNQVVVDVKRYEELVQAEKALNDGTIRVEIGEFQTSNNYKYDCWGNRIWDEPILQFHKEGSIDVHYDSSSSSDLGNEIERYLNNKMDKLNEKQENFMIGYNQEVESLRAKVKGLQRSLWTRLFGSNDN